MNNTTLATDYKKKKKKRREGVFIRENLSYFSKYLKFFFSNLSDDQRDFLLSNFDQKTLNKIKEIKKKRSKNNCE